MIDRHPSKGKQGVIKNLKTNFLKNIHNRQSIVSRPTSRKNSFVCEKWRHPKKPLDALKGDGWAHFKMKWLCPSAIKRSLDIAFLPQSKKTTFEVFCESCSIARSVNVSHPLPECEFASCARTVKTVFSNRTPCSVHLVKSP